MKLIPLKNGARPRRAGRSRREDGMRRCRDPWHASGQGAGLGLMLALLGWFVAVGLLDLPHWSLLVFMAVAIIAAVAGAIWSYRAALAEGGAGAEEE